MKKQLLLITILLVLFTAAKAQKADTARVLVHYKFTHIGDTANRAHPHTENMALYVGKWASVFKSYDGVVADAQFRKAWAAAAASSPDGHPRINRMGGGSRTQYFQYPNEHKMITKDNLMVNEYVVEDAMPVIDWKISSDTTTLAGLHCQKAEGHFKGRDYIVWFCPDLPVHVGPWKLNGLPGVIVDARDSKNEIVFQFDGVEKVTFSELMPIAGAIEKDAPPILRGLDDNPNIFSPPARAIKTTQKDFDKLKVAMQKNPNAVGQAMVAGNRAAGIKTDNIRVPRGGGPMGPMINNPIELPEKK